jgi:hypothetical protein
MDQSLVKELVGLIQEKLQLGKQLDIIKKELRTLRFTDEEIDFAIVEFKKISPRFQNPEFINKLVDKEDWETWYQGPKSNSEAHWMLLKNVLKNKRSRPWNQDMIQSLDISSSAVLTRLAPPKSKTPFKVKGMVIGYVQSGKTANFSAVISKAIDEGYKLVIVLAGMHNILRKQTQARLNEELFKPNETACSTLTIDEVKGDFQKRQNIKANSVLGKKEGWALGVIKKNGTTLRNFISWIEEASDDVIGACPVLIIDDESDQSSINTNEPDEDPTTINGLIRDLMERFSVCSYVGYTATPFANVLVSAENTDDLYPRDFLISLEKPIGYVGTEELFGREGLGGSDASNEGYPVIREIPLEDTAAFSSTKKKKKAGASEELVHSLSVAIDSFIVGCSMRLSRNQWQQHMTMLIHTSQAIGDHQKLKEMISDHIDLMRIDRESNDDELRLRLEQIYLNDFKKVSEKFPDAKVASFDDVWDNSERFISKLEIIMENSKSEERLTFDRPDPLWGIVIGGNVLSRGLTLEGLTVSYFHRTSKGYDTLLQMGRWFGYRPDYVDLTRIFVTNEMQSKFYHLATVEQEIRDEIRAMAANKEKPIDVGLKIRTHPSMTVTSNLKMRNARVTQLTYSGSKIQSLWMNLKNEQLLDHNFKSTVDFVSLLEKYHGNFKPDVFDDFSASLLYMNVSSELILQYLHTQKFSNANSNFDQKNLVQYIKDIVEFGELNKWSVAVMSNKSGTPLDIVGKTVYKMDRSIMKRTFSERDPEASHIKVITVPKDEFIDLKDCFADPTWRSVEQAIESMPTSKRSEMVFRQTLRPQDRGLLLLYPINGNTQMSEADYQQNLQSEAMTMQIKSKRDFFGVCFIFPTTSKRPNTFKYVVNETV